MYLHDHGCESNLRNSRTLFYHKLICFPCTDGGARCVQCLSSFIEFCNIFNVGLCPLWRGNWQLTQEVYNVVHGSSVGGHSPQLIAKTWSNDMSKDIIITVQLTQSLALISAYTTQERPRYRKNCIIHLQNKAIPMQARLLSGVSSKYLQTNIENIKKDNIKQLHYLFFGTFNDVKFITEIY